MVVTSALVEYALALGSDSPQPANYQTPYGMNDFFPKELEEYKQKKKKPK